MVCASSLRKSGEVLRWREVAGNAARGRCLPPILCSCFLEDSVRHQLHFILPPHLHLACSVQWSAVQWSSTVGRQAEPISLALLFCAFSGLQVRYTFPFGPLRWARTSKVEQTHGLGRQGTHICLAVAEKRAALRLMPQRWNTESL